jgi:hypothetical protein
MSVPAEKISELVEYLQGTCNSFDNGMRVCEIPAAEEEAVARAVEEEIFLCEGCGWWEEIAFIEGTKCADCIGED